MLVSFAAAANAGCASDADGSGNEQPLPIKPVTVMDRTVSCKGAPLTIVSGLDGVLFRTAWSRTGTAGELCKGSTNASDCQKSVASRLSEQKTLAGVGTRARPEKAQRPEKAERPEKGDHPEKMTCWSRPGPVPTTPMGTPI